MNDETVFYEMGFYKTVSDDFKYMRYFYEMHPDAVICPQVEDELTTDVNRPKLGMIYKSFSGNIVEMN